MEVLEWLPAVPQAARDGNPWISVLKRLLDPLHLNLQIFVALHMPWLGGLLNTRPRDHLPAVLGDQATHLRPHGHLN